MKRIIILIFFLPFFLHAQEKGKEELVQLSGLVVNSDSSQPIPFSTISLLGTSRGAAANYQGFFSIVVHTGDTLKFSAVGYKPRFLTIPASTEKDLKVIIPLLGDTIKLPETVIYPWPSKEEFRDAFINLELSDDQFTIAMKNLQREKLRAVNESMQMDGSENYNYLMQQLYYKSYYSGGQTPYFMAPGQSIPIPGSLTNPFAWAEFIRYIKEGKFKKKEIVYPVE